MSFPTQPCFSVECDGWTEELLQHPAMKFMFEFENSFTSGKMYTDAEPFGTWHTTDFTYTGETGATSTGLDAFEKSRQLYITLLSKFCHRPHFGIIKETDDGYECLGLADLYGNYKVDTGVKKVTDSDGQQWDFKAPASHRLKFRKDSKSPTGLKLSGMTVYANALPIFAGAVHRKMLPQELMLDNAY
ncbi:hypothetical protein TWF694_007306 [Orbilia ellipsospora]|uniref:Uncharacterized protein n=1 Tax=Orbilia ellipsospora TaxID=2528407 RepID=A0AAV9XHT5_9PEZI